MFSKRYYFTHPKFFKPIIKHHTISLPKHHHHHRHHKRPLNYWAVIKLPNGELKGYQLSKDLQYAIKFDQPKKAIPMLINKLIVIPLSKYNEQRDQAHMGLGQIVFIYKEPHTSNARWITRGQISQIYTNHFGYPKYAQMYNYLKHDYDTKSQQQINQDLHQLIKKPSLLTIIKHII